MASVWEAEDLLLGRVVAVKVLGAQYAADPGARARFQREARTAAQVSDQSHVVTIYDIGEHENDAFIVMEYFAGGTVADRLRAARKADEPIAQETALRWLREAATGLDVAHAAGIVHRDVKPANLLLDAQGRLAVADFGIARLADDTQMTQTGQVLGTAAYISPEQAQGLPATAASDRYALAVVAFELLTGSRPFHGGPPTAQALAHAQSEPPRPSHAAPELPRALDPVLARGLAKDPAERPATATELVAGIEHALGARPQADPTRAFAALGATQPTERAQDGLAAAAIAVPAAIAPQADVAPPPSPPADRPAIAPQDGRPDPAPRAAGRARAIAPQAPAERLREPQRRREPVAAGPAPARRRRGPTPAIVGALLVTVAAVALVLALSSGGDPRSSADSRHARSTPASGTARTATTAAAGTQRQTTAPASSTSAKGAGAAALNDRGHRLVQQGSYAEAVAPLQASVDAYRAAGDRALPYAFALYNLGVALNRSGNPTAAVPLLRERLQFHNQTATVQAELDSALAKLGQAPAGKPGKKAKGNGKG
jgi:serine/threonine-protein kinase